MERLKHCGKCSRDLPLTAFAKNKAKKDGLQERCTECRNKHYVAKGKFTKKPPTKEQKRKQVIRSYGLTEEEFNTMLKNQGHKCAICGTTDWGRPSPSIDHCHTTGKVRGLLCNNCNRALGLFKDNPETLKRAAEYLK